MTLTESLDMPLRDKNQKRQAPNPEIWALEMEPGTQVQSLTKPPVHPYCTNSRLSHKKHVSPKTKLFMKIP